jgi:hypothetical protein
MTVDQVQDLVRSQLREEDSTTKNLHGIILTEALIQPRKIVIIDRIVAHGRVHDEELEVWVVGKEGPVDGYQIVLRDDGLQFGLASPGCPSDPHPILCGWYGSLQWTFMGM